MSDKALPITLSILGKDYKIACPPSEQETLLTSALQLDQQMRELRDSGKIVGADRIAVMAALHLAHDLVNLREENKNLKTQQKGGDLDLSPLHHKIDDILNNA